MQHIERVYEIDRDFRTKCQQSESIILRIQKAISSSQISIEFESQMTSHKQKLILIIKMREVSELKIISHIQKVLLNYIFQNLKINTRTIESEKDVFLIKRILEKDSKLLSLCHTASLRAELKIREFKRSHFVNNFDNRSISRNQSRCISMSLLIFIDDFELYRNSYRNLIKIYVIVTALIFKERARRTNVFFFIFESHDSNFADVIEIMKSFVLLNEDIKVFINKQKTFLCVFTLVYIDDMSQQQKNSDFKSQRTTLRCRFCFISIDERHNLNYNILENERYHHQAVQMRKEMNNIKQITKRDTYDSK